MPRFNQGRAAACVDAEFVVPPDLDADLRVGLFAGPATYRARIRFANAASQSDTERDVRGMSIDVAGVPGENLTPGETRQDFVLNSHPVMMVGHTRQFLDLLRAVDAGGAKEALFFVAHPHAARAAPARNSWNSSALVSGPALSGYDGREDAWSGDGGREQDGQRQGADLRDHSAELPFRERKGSRAGYGKNCTRPRSPADVAGDLRTARVVGRRGGSPNPGLRPCGRWRPGAPLGPRPPRTPHCPLRTVT